MRYARHMCVFEQQYLQNFEISIKTISLHLFYSHKIQHDIIEKLFCILNKLYTSDYQVSYEY